MRKLCVLLLMVASSTVGAFEYGSKEGFPSFQHNNQTYLNNAATTQKPQEVIDALVEYYEKHNGGSAVCKRSSASYERSREAVAEFINAKPSEVVFVRGATEAINFIAMTWGKENIERGDEILISELEHNANYLPWEALAEEQGARLSFIPIKEDGTLDVDALKKNITDRTKIISVTHISNAIGSQVPIEDIIALARERNIPVMVDASQSIAHEKIDVERLNPDFLVFSGHKMLAPVGVGVLYIREDIQESVPQYHRGGGESCTKFEAGTPSAADAFGLQAAIRYIKENIDYEDLRNHNAFLTKKLIEGLEGFDGVTIYGPLEELKERGHLVSFVIDGMSSIKVAELLEMQGVTVRGGRHCAELPAEALGYEDTVRVSFYCYNDQDDVERLLEALAAIISFHRESEDV